MAFQHSPRLAAYPLAMPPRLYPVAVPVSPPKQQQQQQQQQQGEFSKGERTWKSILGNVTTTTTTIRTALPHKDGEKEKHGSRRVMGSSRRYALLPLQQVLLQQKQQRPTFGMRRRVTTPV